ncbi:MAG: DUF3299 domain-containing protein [Planctomycetales bacterium]
MNHRIAVAGCSVFVVTASLLCAGCGSENIHAAVAESQAPVALPVLEQASRRTSAAVQVAATPSRPKRVLAQRSAPSKKASKRTKNITFDSVKFKMKKNEEFKRSMLTKEIEALQGQKIKIRGWMHPAVYTNTNIKRFVLVRDNQECCFGPGAMLYDCMYVEMASDKTTDFTSRPFFVEGVLDLEPLKVGKKTFAIYRLREAKTP